MATKTKRLVHLAQKLMQDKKQLADYYQSGDESKKPVGSKFVKPFALPAKRD